jgi:hypothetical protein
MNRIYFYPEIDTIYIPPKASNYQSWLFGWHNECGLWGKVQRIATSQEIGCLDLYHFTTLEKITIVHPVINPQHHNWNCSYTDRICFFELCGTCPDWHETLKKAKVLEKHAKAWTSLTRRKAIAVHRRWEIPKHEVEVGSMGLSSKSLGMDSFLSSEGVDRFLARTGQLAP